MKEFVENNIFKIGFVSCFIGLFTIFIKSDICSICKFLIFPWNRSYYYFLFYKYKICKQCRYDEFMKDINRSLVKIKCLLEK